MVMGSKRSRGSTRCGARCVMCLPAIGRSACIRSCCLSVPALPPERQRLWTYFKLWPNVAFDIYPDQIDFMQFLPVSADRNADSRNRLRASRRSPRDARRALPQLAHQPQSEPRRQSADRPRASRHGLQQLHRRPLSENEVCLRSFARRMRTLIPESRYARNPAAGAAPSPR